MYTLPVLLDFLLKYCHNSKVIGAFASIVPWEKHMKWTEAEVLYLWSCLKKVRDDRRFWPDEQTFQLSHQILPVPASEVAVVKDGKLLLQFRTFAEWPAPYNKPGWYIPGGYVPWGASLQESCLIHLKKDLVGECKRTGLDGDYVSGIKLSEPVVIGTQKWMPGEHPFGCPVSLVCVCELQEGDIVETDWLKWSSVTIPTDVPLHQKFQDAVFMWLQASPEEKALILRLNQFLS